MNAVTRLVDVAIDRPDNSAETGANRALAAARTITISTPAEYEATGAALRDIKSRWNAVEAERKKLLQPIDEARERIQTFFRTPLAALAQAEAIVKGKIAEYQREQERLRLEEQRKLEEKARREREELEARAREAERKAKEQAEADRRAAEAAAAAGRAAEAAKLKARADAKETKAAEKAAQLEQRAAEVVAPIAQREVPKVAGLATREVWRFEILDASKINPLWLMPDEAKIRKTVNALKGDAAAAIGSGVRVWCDKQIASSSR